MGKTTLESPALWADLQSMRAGARVRPAIVRGPR